MCQSRNAGLSELSMRYGGWLGFGGRECVRASVSFMK